MHKHALMSKYTHASIRWPKHAHKDTLKNVNVFLVRSRSRLLALWLSRHPSTIVPTEITDPSSTPQRDGAEENIAVMLV